MSWALKSERVGRFCKLAGNEFQTVGALKPKERSPTDLKLLPFSGRACGMAYSAIIVNTALSDGVEFRLA